MRAKQEEKNKFKINKTPLPKFNRTLQAQHLRKMLTKDENTISLRFTPSSPRKLSLTAKSWEIIITISDCKPVKKTL